jgi:hypothetical protein
MHHQFNIQQLYALSILYLCVLYLFENTAVVAPDDGHENVRNMLSCI